jgi:hypothetical protein
LKELINAPRFDAMTSRAAVDSGELHERLATVLAFLVADGSKG